MIRMLVKFNSDWLTQQPVLITHLRRIWNDHPLFEKAKNVDDNNNEHWREIKMLAKCLLTYLRHKPGEIEILFQLLKVYIVRSIPSFHFFKKFLEGVCKVNIPFWNMQYVQNVSVVSPLYIFSFFHCSFMSIF